MKFVPVNKHYLYQKAWRNGARRSASTIAVYALRDKQARFLASRHPQHRIVNRIGISASKKVGGAVQRNRAKRVIREAYRQIEREIGVKKGWIIVITPYPRSAQCKMDVVKRDLAYCLGKLELLDSPKEDHATARPIDGGLTP